MRRSKPRRAQPAPVDAWRAEVRQELRRHQVVDDRFLWLAAFGVAVDLDNAYSLLAAARHAPCLDAECAECWRNRRVISWLIVQYQPVVEAIARVCASSSSYAGVRMALGKPDTPRPTSPILRTRWRVTTDHDALVILLWVTQRVIRQTHAPGAIAGMWRAAFVPWREAHSRHLAAIWQKGRADVVPDAPCLL